MRAITRARRSTRGTNERCHNKRSLLFLNWHLPIHRDLKPDNLLLTNQHYAQLRVEEDRAVYSK